MNSGKIIRLARETSETELTPQPFTAAEFYNEDEMIVVNGQMLKIVEQVKRIAPLNINVLITGESGVGKEELARLIHRKSGRQGPFICVNCAALPENLVESEMFGHKRGAFTSAVSDYKGKFLMADGGTLFLDEIGDMQQQMQAKLLQVLDQSNFERERYFYPVGSEQKVKSDFRIISASNQDIENLMEEKKFRQDLFFRLNVARFHVPSLRERPEEIPILAQAILQRITASLNSGHIYFSPKCLKFLSGLKWPGNVRELQNLITIAAASFLNEKKDSSVIETEDLKELIRERDGFLVRAEDFLESGKGLNDYKQKIYLEALELYRGNITKTARNLGINPRTIYRFLKSRKINPSDFANQNRIEVKPEAKDRQRYEKTEREEKEKKEVLPHGFNQEKPETKENSLIVSGKESAPKKEVKKEPQVKLKEKEGTDIFQPPTQPLAANQEFIMLRGTRYTREELISSFEANEWSKKKLAAALKIGYQSATTLAKKLDIKPPDGIWGRNPNYTREKLESILKENDWNQTKTAVALGIAQARLWALIKNRGIAAPDGIWQKRKQKNRNLSKEALIELFKENDWSQKRVAAKLGINRSCVSYLCKSKNIFPPNGTWRATVKKPTALEIILGRPWPDGEQKSRLN